MRISFSSGEMSNLLLPSKIITSLFTLKHNVYHGEALENKGNDPNINVKEEVFLWESKLENVELKASCSLSAKRKSHQINLFEMYCTFN